MPWGFVTWCKLAIWAGVVAVASISPASASLLVIGDVDAMNTGVRPVNFDLLNNARFGGTDVLWLDGGTNNINDGRNTILRSQWTTAGVALTDDNTADISASLAGRDLVVVTMRFASAAGFSATGRAKIADYLSTGGNMLYVTQPDFGSIINSHNTFLQDIGSSIRFTGSVGPGIFDVAPGSFYHPAGDLQFQLSGVTGLTGGLALVSDGSGRVGVACENCVPIPEPSTLSLILLALLGTRVARRNA